MTTKRVWGRMQDRRGDTLVEVVIALAIIGGIMISVYGVVTSAYGVAQDSRERTQAMHVAQRQAELLRAYRDGYLTGNGATADNGWADFRTKVSQIASTCLDPAFNGRFAMTGIDKSGAPAGITACKADHFANAEAGEGRVYRASIKTQSVTPADSQKLYVKIAVTWEGRSDDENQATVDLMLTDVTNIGRITR